jgi:hypothetical protein
MKRCGLPAALALVVLLISQNLWSRTEFFKIEDLRPGMKGIGKTCYRGSKPEEFQVEILGVMRGIGPGANAVLARFSGGPIDQVGVFEGMSGSPVYIDGKLLGAVAFSFPFAKDAVGGITPITQMVDAFTEAQGGVQIGSKVILKKSMLWQYLLPPTQSDSRNEGLSVIPPEMLLRPALSLSQGHALVPIATPLSLGGFSAAALQRFAPELRALGFSVLQGSGVTMLQTGASAKSNAPKDNAPLEPGSNIVVPLVRGDLDAAAGGTVTHIEGDKLYAFGHLLFDLGVTELPMHKARAITVFPSMQSSFKILETTDPVGTIRQDRSSGIYGILGQNAKMIPIQVHINTSRGVTKELHFEVARDQFLTPFLVNFTIYSSIISTERAMGIATLKVKGKISIKGEQPVEIENRFSSESNAPAFASLSIAIPVNFLLAQGYKNLEFEKIDLEISAQEDDRTATLDSLRIGRTELKAGETVDLNLVYQRNNGDMIQDSFPVKIPVGVTPGPLAMLVGDGTSMMSMDAHEQGDELIPKDLTQLIKFINNLRKNDRLYVRLFRREAGAVIRGEGLPSLPPSVLTILRSDRGTGGMSSISTAAFMEYELPPSDYVVSGMRTVNLVIKP